MSPTIAGDFGIQQAVSALLCWSDAQDAVLKARIAATASAHRAGFAEGEAVGCRAALNVISMSAWRERRAWAAAVAHLNACGLAAAVPPELVPYLRSCGLEVWERAS
jgi:hypothetical protein